MVSILFVLVSTVAMVINTLPDMQGPLDENVSTKYTHLVILFVLVSAA